MRTLKRGMRGPDVGKWQAFLVSKEWLDPPPDDSFGPITERATVAYQQANGLAPSGAADAKTLELAGTQGFSMLRRLTNSEVTEAISQAARKIIGEHHQDPFGTEISFEADGKSYVGRIEEHYHPPGGPIKPWGHHAGVSVFEVVGAPVASDIVDADAVPDPDDPAYGGVANVETPDLPRFHLSERSLQRMQGVHPDLVKVIKRAIEITELDFTVLEGLRTLERQRQLVAQGRSQTLNSRHLTGHAVDLAPLVNGQVVWDWPAYDKLAQQVKAAAVQVGVSVQWGGDWKSFPDGPHWQLPVSYG